MCKVQGTAEARSSQGDLGLNSSEIPKALIEVVVNVGRDKWWELGVALDRSIPALSEYDESGFSKERRTREIIYNWQRDKGDLATIGCLLEACNKVEVGGAVRRQAYKKFGLVFV